MSTILNGDDNFSTVETALDWVGVDYDDPDAIGANPVAKIYPDGTIVGSTDNGDYVKYPNGELSFLMSPSNGITVVVLFPHSTINTRYTVSSMHRNGDTITVSWGYFDETTTQLILRCSREDAFGNVRVQGRWKD